jgi:16S rRNA G527 N7-methylase RsmG
VKWHVQLRRLRISPASLAHADEICGWSSLSQQQQDQLQSYLDLVMEQNKTMNLTGE